MNIKAKTNERVEPYSFPLGKPVNRQQRRAVNIELLKIAPKLNEIEMQFFGCLFDNELNLSYKEIYIHFHDLFEKQFKQFQFNGVFRVTFPNTGYFASHYKPVERY